MPTEPLLGHFACGTAADSPAFLPYIDGHAAILIARALATRANGLDLAHFPRMAAASSMERL
jgi:hypothetical protein